jgi:hypothetical protein
MVSESIKAPAVLERAVADEKKDLTLADELLNAQDAKALHQMVRRLIGDRIALAQGIEALGSAMTILRVEPRALGQDKDATAAVERVATEAIGLAREVVRAFSARSGVA